MSRDNPNSKEQIAALLAVDELCDEFEAALQRGKQPELNDFFARCAEPFRTRLFGELLDIAQGCNKLAMYEHEFTEFVNENGGFAETVSRIQLYRTGISDTHPLAFNTKGGPAQPGRVAGVQFNGYEILGEIARGGMGVVFRARQTKANRLVALKQIIAGDGASLEQVRRFHTEAESAANLRHPHIVPVFDVGQSEGTHYFSMALIEGESLSQRLNEGPLESKIAVELLLKVVEAIHYAHAHGVIHRDIKPSNILLDEKQEPFVTDFGLAKRVEAGDELTVSGQILGTPCYMPPEQASGSVEIDARSDVYSLGAILYAMLTGRPPFQSASVFDTLSQVIERDPAAPGMLNPGVDRDLETICLKCLEKDPANRYQSAQALLEELQRFQRGEPILARPIGPLGKTWKWCQRQPVVAALTSAVALTLLIGAAVSTTFGILASQRAAEAEKLSADKDGLLIQKDDLIASVQSEKIISDTSKYGLQIQEASLAIENGEYDHAEELLGETDPQFRRWEYGYLQTKLNSRVHILAGHKERIGCVAFNTKRNIIASGDLTGEFIVWDAKTRSIVKRIAAHSRGILALAFSRDGTRLATSGVDAKIAIWRTDDWTQLRQWALPVASMRIRFTPGNTQLATAGGDQFVRLWNASDGELVKTLEGHTAPVKAIDISSDGAQLVSAGDDAKLRLWNLETGETVKVFSGHERSVWGVAVSRDSNTIISGGMDNRAIVWNVETGEPTVSVRQGGPVFDVCFTADPSQFVSAGYDGNVRLLDLADGKVIANLIGHKAPSFTLAFNTTTNRIISGSWDKSIRIWSEIGSKKPNSFSPHEEDILAVSVAPDSRSYALCSADGTVAIGDLDERKVRHSLKQHTDTVADVCHDSTGERIATASHDRTVRIWDAATGEPLAVLNDFEQSLNCVAFHPDGKSVFAGDSEGVLSMTGLSTDEAVWRTKAIGAAVNDIAVSLNGSRIATAGADFMIRIWDGKQGKLIAKLTGHADEVQSVAFRGDGLRLASASKDRTIRIWNMESLDVEATLTGHADWVNSVDWFDDDRRLVSASSDFTIRVWDPITARPVVRIGATQRSIAEIDAEITQGHAGRVWMATGARDGKSIVSCGSDRTVRIWSSAAP